MDFIERAEHIADLFSTFKNPDKETVLTPWRVVNLQVAKSVGGLNFYDDNFESATDGATSNLHWVDVDKEVTSSVYKTDTKILDINSKTGLYPLHSAISLYYKTITERTLIGYKNYKTNVAYIENFSDTLKSSVEEGKKLVEESFKT